MCVVLDEAEAAGCFLEAVEAHDEALDFAAPVAGQRMVRAMAAAMGLETKRLSRDFAFTSSATMCIGVSWD